jgi:hypothetical protein
MFPTGYFLNVKKSYSGKWKANMLADYSWTLVRATAGEFVTHSSVHSFICSWI